MKEHPYDQLVMLSNIYIDLVKVNTGNGEIKKAINDIAAMIATVTEKMRKNMVTD